MYEIDIVIPYTKGHTKLTTAVTQPCYLVVVEVVEIYESHKYAKTPNLLYPLLFEHLATTHWLKPHLHPTKHDNSHKVEIY